MNNQDLKLQVGVKVLLKNKDGKYLLLKRNQEKYPDTKFLWDIVGGRIDAGAGLMENLKREVLEETQLSMAAEPILVAAQDIIKPDKHVVRLTYLGEADGEPVLSEEHVEGKWFTAEGLLGIKDGLDSYFRELIDKKIITL